MELKLLKKTFSDKRMQICKSCENYKIGICIKCGCFMKLKTKLVKATCPENKWEETYFKEEW